MGVLGPLTKSFFAHCGYPEEWMQHWVGSTRLFQDIGLLGDNAWDEFETMHRDFGVDLTNFDITKYFPSELSWESSIVRHFKWTKRAKKIKDKYPEITLDMLENVLSTKKWIF